MEIPTICDPMNIYYENFYITVDSGKPLSKGEFILPSVLVYVHVPYGPSILHYFHNNRIKFNVLFFFFLVLLRVKYF